MKRIISLVLSAVMFFSFCLVPSFAVEEDAPRLYLKLADGYSEGDSSFAVDLYVNDEGVYGLSYFGLLMDYTPNVVLKKSVSHYGGMQFSETVIDTPYSILGVAGVDDLFCFPYEDTLVATFYFDIIDVGYEGPVEITLELDSENGAGGMNGESIDDEVTVEGFTMEIVIPDDGNDDEYEEEIPDFDDMNYTGSDSIYVNENFMNNLSFTNDFDPGAFYIQNGYLYGWLEAKALQSNYVSTTYNGNTIFDNNSPRTWLTFDMSITMSLSDDVSNGENKDRWINLCYCNDNYMYNGYGGGRQFICFSYDNESGCFRLSANGWNPGAMSQQLMPAVYKKIPMDGSEFFNLGLSVGKDRIRCYYNGELIFDYYNTTLKIGDTVEAPFFLWNEGNLLTVSNITIAEYGYLYGEDFNDSHGYVVGNDGFAVNYYGGDNTVVPNTVKKIGKFTFIKNPGLKSVFIPDSVTTIERGTFTGADEIEIRCYEGSAAEKFAKSDGVPYRLVLPGDVNDDGSVSATDVAAFSRWLVGAEVTMYFGADADVDGETNVADLAVIRRMITG